MKEKSVNQAARTLGKARRKNTSPEERKAQGERIAEDLNVALHMLGPNAYASVTGEGN